MNGAGAPGHGLQGGSPRCSSDRPIKRKMLGHRRGAWACGARTLRTSEADDDDFDLERDLSQAMEDVDSPNWEKVVGGKATGVESERVDAASAGERVLSEGGDLQGDRPNVFRGVKTTGNEDEAGPPDRPAGRPTACRPSARPPDRWTVRPLPSDRPTPRPSGRPPDWPTTRRARPGTGGAGEDKVETQTLMVNSGKF